MLEELGMYIKLAVDTRRGVVAGGGAPFTRTAKRSCSTMAASKRISGEPTGFQPPSKSAMKR